MWKRLARKAVNIGARQGMRYVSKKLREPGTRQALSDLVGGKEPAQVLREYRGKPGSEEAREDDRGDSRGRKSDADRAPLQSDAFEKARKGRRSAPKQGFPHRPSHGYPGDHTGPIKPLYAPDLDGEADPGEVVWGWVPYEEDHSQGKDRPVLVVGRDGKWLLALMLTSKDNVPGGVGEVRTDEHGSRYINVGAGDWDSRGRPSEIRLDRVIRIEQGAVRREGAIMPMETFSHIVANITTD
ncbi:type II toxin-antitoxin system PemK/MazF family toxin [Brevibacterium litoralis]|uniref:type II toxin-antitoxin system PemK/MazF family toxin n=1 Tax=Brevibacterium litoralis TaxID=3138935 RepID=UPI0032ED2124